MIKRKKRKKRRKKKDIPDIKVDQILLNKRQIFLTGKIDEKLADKLIKEMIALDILANTPILLWINSRGGEVASGFAIVDCIKGLRSPLITAINGRACSMAGVISISGTKKIMSEHSVWMIHDMFTGAYDYMEKVRDKIKFSEELQTELFKFLRNNTKLTEKDLEKARNGELWLKADECKKKGIVDMVVK
jgi:ATP-dependent Clp protease protease subunit